jgi:hypothetical protein
MYSMGPSLAELNSGLFFDAFESSNWNVWPGKRCSDSARFDRVFELFVASGLRNLEPAFIFEPANHLSAVHRGTPFHLKNTHFVYTDQ